MPEWDIDHDIEVKYIIMPRWAEPRRHTVVVVCVCEWVSFREILFAFSPWSLNIKGWNVQCKLNAMLSWNRIGEFWIRDFIVQLWRNLLTLTTVFHYPESADKQAAQNRLLSNLTVLFVPQDRRLLWQSVENKRVKARFHSHDGLQFFLLTPERVRV